MSTSSKRSVATRLGLLIVAVWLSGCVGPKIDWGLRVGIYTYDQAIMELGPPEKSARTSDNTMVADWLLYRGQTYAHSTTSYGYYPGYFGSYLPAYVDTYTGPNHYLRLIFDPSGKLQSWKQYYQ